MGKYCLLIIILNFNKSNSEGRLKSSYDDLISPVEDFFDQWAKNTVTSMEEMCRLQGGLCWEINLIWFHSNKVSWLAYELFSQHSHVLYF